MSVIMCPGFKAAGVAAELKKKGKKDLGLICSRVPANVAGVFTKNRVKAAPVLLDMELIKSGVCQAVIVNSGSANCCTGEQGMRDAEAMASLAASELGISNDLVFVASTGVIGEPLPIEKIKTAIPDLVKSLQPEGIPDLARSIMTTDTVPKMVSAQGIVEGKTFTVNCGREDFYRYRCCQRGRNDPSGYGHNALLCLYRCWSSTGNFKRDSG